MAQQSRTYTDEEIAALEAKSKKKKDGFTDAEMADMEKSALKKKKPPYRGLGMSFGPFGTFPQEEQSEPVESLPKTVAGLAEGVGNLATGMVAFPVGAAAKLATAPFVGPEKAKEIGGGIAEKITYQPKTETGKNLSGVLAAPMAPVGMAQQALVKFVFPKDEKARAWLDIGTEAALAALAVRGGLKVVNKLGRGAKRTVEAQEGPSWKTFGERDNPTVENVIKEMKTKPPIGRRPYMPIPREIDGPALIDDVGAVYGEGGSVIGTSAGTEMVRPKLGPSTGKGPNKLMRWTEQNIKRISPPLYAKVKDYLFERESMAGRDASILASVDKIMGDVMSDVIKGKSRAEADAIIHTRLADMVEGRNAPSSMLEELAFYRYKDLMEGIVSDIAKLKEQGETLTIKSLSGEREWTPVEGYYPRVYSNLKELLESSSPNGLKAQDVIGNKLAARLYPEDFANPATKAEAVAKALEVARNFTSKTKAKQYGHLESSRLLQPEDVAELEAEGILKREYGTKVIIDYIKKTQDRLAWTRNFGTDVYWNGQKVPRVFAEALANTKNPAGKEFIVKTLERATGEKSTPFGRMSEKLNVAATPKMILATPANMWQWLGNTVPLQPLTDVPPTIWEAVKRNFGDKSMNRFYRESGIQITPEKVIERVGGDPTLAPRLQSLFYKLNGFTGTEASNSFYGGRAGARKAVTLSKRLAEYPQAYRAGAWEQQLKKLGVDSRTISEIKSGKVLGYENMDTLHRAAWETKRISQFANDMFARPLSFSNKNAPMFTKFKNFPISQLQAFSIDEVMKPAWEFIKTGGRMGDITPALKAPIALGVAGALTTAIKDQVWGVLGKKDMYDRFIKDKPFLQQWMFYISQAGGLGIATDIMIASGAERLATSIAGPVLSDAYEIAKGFYDVRKDIEAAWKVKSPRLIWDRRARWAKVFADKAGKMQPSVKMALTKFWPEYAESKTFSQWENQYTKARADYMNLYEYKGKAEAEEYWATIVDTWGIEYLDVVGHLPEKPTDKEVASYQEGKISPFPKR